MFDIKMNSPIGGDETAAYRVILKEKYTLKKFIDEVLTKEREWGLIEINDKDVYEYRYGKLLQNPTELQLSKIITRISAAGGWSRMDYFVNI